MTLRASAPHARPRWIALFFTIVLCTGLMATVALATDTSNPPTFTYVNDSLGPDDQPGQKDLNSQSSVSDGLFLWVSWKWDDTKWPGGNTGDACALFTTDSDQNIDFAACVTVGGNPAAQQETALGSTHAVMTRKTAARVQSSSFQSRTPRPARRTSQR